MSKKSLEINVAIFFPPGSSSQVKSEIQSSSLVTLATIMLFLVLKFNDQTYLVLMFVTMTKNLVCVRNGMKILSVVTFFFKCKQNGNKVSGDGWSPRSPQQLEKLSEGEHH